MDRRLFLKRGGAASLSVPAVFAGMSQAKAEECAAIQLAFSPHGGGEGLVLNTIDSATRSIRLMAYSFTSPSVVRALLVAKKARGVDVAVTVDYRNNMEEDRSGHARAALNALAYAHVPVRTVSVFPLQHSKFVVIDSETVQTGSFNYSLQAARYNSENVLVLRSRPDLARSYLENWHEVTALGVDYSPT
jgi:phosphatidylserine/phosphatidylglycerophosphate/cardiolipin synthase-like enzyme